MKRKLVLIALLVSASFFAVVVAYAQGEGPSYPTDDDVNRVAKKLYCPICPNTPLDVCETQACKDWRAQIRDELTQGWTEQQVIDYFVAQYGERVLAEPQREGFTSLVWLLPVIGTLLGVWIVYEILRSWRKRQPTSRSMVVAKGDIAPEVLQRIERELREMD
ncbi:MAG: cytochrome c-type biogenesis protein CcmH [Chloroflexota bacterium]